MNYLMTEREYNAGGEEFTIRETLECGWVVDIVYETENGVQVVGVYDAHRKGTHCHLDSLTDDELTEVESAAITSYEIKCEEMQNER